jgi:hypothetical protein
MNIPELQVFLPGDANASDMAFRSRWRFTALAAALLNVLYKQDR